MKRLLFLLIALSTATYVWADDEDEERMNAEYARNHTLEVNFGPMWNLRSYNDAPSLAVGFMGNHILGGGIQIRYTSFLSRHWFFFLSGEYSSMKDDYSNKFYDHCSDRYEYMIDYINKEYIDFECFSFGDNIGHIYNQVLAGAVYRFDFGRHWSLRSRLGAGYRKLIAEPDYNYIRWDRNQTHKEESWSLLRRPNDFEEIRVKLCDRKHRPIERTRSMAVAPSIQLCFTPHNSMFFSFEAQWTGTMRRLYERIDIYDVHQEIRDYPEDIDFPELGDNEFILDHYDPHKEKYIHKIVSYDKNLKSSSYHKVWMGNFLNLRFGIGWNIGRKKR